MISMDVLALLATVALIVVALGLYWLPSITGYVRRDPGLVTLVVINALLGWTVVGWILAFGMALGVRGRRSIATR
jgi:hypothetical protein